MNIPGRSCKLAGAKRTEADKHLNEMSKALNLGLKAAKEKYEKLVEGLVVQAAELERECVQKHGDCPVLYVEF
jgi:hypothetical protein